ncbi:MAG TPA: ABC transporter substrate-binding protein [Propionicimonas sp.]|uniref:ABC transporter substrate-binding protein n=1 Tax=Propionicimonas sp. TaxID=1955623 RepID=UPI002F416175
MRKISMGLAALGVAASMTLAACSGATPAAPSGSAPASSAAEKPYIAIISKGFQHQFWQAVKAGAEQEAAKENVTITFEGPAAETEIESQMNMLTAALAKKPAALGFAALDSKAAAATLQQFADAKIPVIAFDSGVDSDIPLTTASTDNKAAAAEGAKHMCELIGNKGKVGLIVHDQTSKSGTDRRDGFIEGIKANCPDVTLLETQYGAGDQAKSADIAKNMIAANPDIAGIFGSNEGSAIGAVKGVQEAGDAAKNVKLVGFDSGQAQIDAITAGTMAGAITQNPVGMGEQLVMAAVKAIKGETLEKVIDTGFYWYDKTNITDPKIAAVLYK